MLKIFLLLSSSVLLNTEIEENTFVFSIIGDVPSTYSDLEGLNNVIDELNNNQSFFYSSCRRSF